MKSNEAPEKLYLLPNGLISYCRNSDEDVEYTYTDAFIEKACEWFGPVFKDLAGYYSGAELLDDFKNYMKGE